MKCLSLLSLFLFSLCSTKGQNYCIDSSIHERYSTLLPYSDSVMLHKQMKTIDEGAIALGHLKTTRANGYGIVIRFNKNGTVRWSKRIISNPFSGYIALETIEEAYNGNIHIIAKFNNGTYDGKPPFHLLVLSQDGNLINQKRIGFINSPNLNYKYVRTSLILKYGTDSLMYIFSGQTNAFTENQLFLITADNSGTIGSSTIINMQPSGGWDAPIFRYGKLNGSQLILYGSSSFIGQCVNGSSNGLAFFSVKIDMLSKTVLDNKAYCAPANSSLSSAYQTPRDFFSPEAYDNTFFLSNGNVIMTRAYQGIDSNSSGITNRLFSISTFDSSFNHLHSEYVVTGNIMRDKTIQELLIDSSGIRYFSFYDYKSKLIYYALADSANKIFLQKKIAHPSSKQYTDYTRNNILDKKNFVTLTILSYDNNSTHIDKFKILDIDTAQTCFGIDTSFLSFAPSQVSPINWQGQFMSEAGILEELPINFLSADYPLQRTIICNIVKRCDTLKLNAPDTVCNISQPVRITAFKNGLCPGKMVFTFDTTAVTSYTQPNDTTLLLSFTKAWSGKIYASPTACSLLKDSIELKVVPPLPNFSLGADFQFCPDKNYTLKIPSGFKQYIWQDGSSDSSFVVHQPGTYYVTATDFCGRIYSDTININNSNLTLNAGKDKVICKSESITLTATAGYNNYVWTPPYHISNSYGITALVFPDETTNYSVTAEIFPGCFLKDTVLISVKDCPQYFFIPNAFSPNRDGKNDIFKPVISGVLSSYEFSIYNRWGQRIFTTSDKYKGWDGQVNGKEQNNNVFVWQCRYKFANQSPQIQKGTVVLIK